MGAQLQSLIELQDVELQIVLVASGHLERLKES